VRGSPSGLDPWHFFFSFFFFFSPPHIESLDPSGSRAIEGLGKVPAASERCFPCEMRRQSLQLPDLSPPPPIPILLTGCVRSTSDCQIFLGKMRSVEPLSPPSSLILTCRGGHQASFLVLQICLPLTSMSRLAASGVLLQNSWPSHAPGLR